MAGLEVDEPKLDASKPRLEVDEPNLDDRKVAKSHFFLVPPHDRKVTFSDFSTLLE